MEFMLNISRCSQKQQEAGKSCSETVGKHEWARDRVPQNHVHLKFRKTPEGADVRMPAGGPCWEPAPWAPAPWAPAGLTGVCRLHAEAWTPVGVGERERGVTAHNRKWKTLPSRVCLMRSIRSGRRVRDEGQAAPVTPSERVLTMETLRASPSHQTVIQVMFPALCMPSWERTGHHLWSLMVWVPRYCLQVNIWESLHNELFCLQRYSDQSCRIRH